MTDGTSPGPESQRLALAITSSTGMVGVALGLLGSDSGAEVLARAGVETDRRHAEEITPLIQTIMADGGRGLNQLDLVVIDVGPGRFTGLRVGVATARSLAFALEVPVVGLSSLEILAARWLPNEAGEVTAVVDARRGEVFQQVFSALGPVGQAEVGPAEELSRWARGLIVGDGADRYQQSYQRDGQRWLEGCDPDAAIMLNLAAVRPGRPGAGIEPNYMRDPDVNPKVTTRPRA